MLARIRAQRANAQANHIYFTDWADKYLKVTIITFWVLCLLALGISLGVSGIREGNDNHTTSSNARFLRLIDANGPLKQRQQAARTFLRFNSRVQKIYDYDTVGLSDTRSKAAAIQAATGRPAKLDVSHHSLKSEIRWVKRYKLYDIIVLYLAFSFVFTFVFYSEDEYRRRPYPYISQLPWGRPWPWVMMLLLGPIVWIAIIGSLIRRYFLRRKEQVHAIRMDLEWQRRAPVPDRMDRGDGDPLPLHRMARDRGVAYEDHSPVPESAAIPPPDSYTSAPVMARQVYVGMRTGHTAFSRARRIDKLKEWTANVRARLVELGAEIRTQQSKISGYEAERRELESMKDPEEPADLEKIAQEFDRIFQLPGVLAVQVVGERIRLIVRSSIEHRGTTYDLGDWEMDFGPDIWYIKAVELRSGLRRDWSGRYPAYRDHEDTFCFGSRLTDINLRLERGQYLEAMSLSIDCLNSVNEEHLDRISRAFKEVVTP